MATTHFTQRRSSSSLQSSMTKRKVSRAELINSLRKAAELKGATPTGPDADAHKYGLFAKQRYVAVFGLWNNAIREAGLPVNEPAVPSTSQPIRAVVQDAETLQVVLTRKIDQERMRLDLLQELLDEVRSA